MTIRLAASLALALSFAAAEAALAQAPSRVGDVNRGTAWFDASPARSCRMVCEAVGAGWKAVTGPGTAQNVHPDYVCARKSSGVPGVNHSYSADAAKLCHYQQGGKGTGDTNFSCLCALP